MAQCFISIKVMHWFEKPDKVVQYYYGTPSAYTLIGKGSGLKPHESKFESWWEDNSVYGAIGRHSGFKTHSLLVRVQLHGH